MRVLALVAVVFLVSLVGVGFYRGWFQLSTDTSSQRPSATITVDKDRIRADEQKAKDELQGFGRGAPENTGDSAKQPERRP